MKVCAVVLALVAMTACSPSSPATHAASPVETPTAAPPGPVRALPHALPPPSPTRFVGAWAATEEGCTGEAWRFTREGVTTPSGARCVFSTVSPVTQGFEVAATCTAEGPDAATHLQIRFAESAQAMMVEGGPFTPTALVFCAP